jgi:hypothetical protein
MGKPQSERTHGARIDKQHKAAKLSADQIANNKHAKTRERGEIRRKNARIEAEARQQIRDKRSTVQQVALLNSRPGNSVREVARLLKSETNSELAA